MSGRSPRPDRRVTDESCDHVAVVIPVYRPTLSVPETVSLHRCRRVLGRYPTILVGPRSLDAEAYGAFGVTEDVRRFDDSFFQSVRGYSALLRQEHFYDAFADFTYILIYQLDCYVFEDALADWCRAGFDYLGAPWTDFEWLDRKSVV